MKRYAVAVGANGVLFATALLLAACGQDMAEPATAPPQDDGVDVLAYELAMQLEPETLAIQAHVRMRVHHADTLSMLRLQLEGLTVDAALVDGEAAQVERSGTVLSVPLAGGTSASEVQIQYHGTPDVGLYRKQYEGQTVAFTDSWPRRGRGWLPAVHEPSDPATFTLSLDIPAGYEAVASGREVARDTLAQRIRYQWSLDTAAPTYTFAFAVSDFSVTHTALGDTLPIRYFLLAPDSARAGLLRRTPQSIAVLSSIVGPYAFDQFEVVEAPISYGGMENASAPFLRTELFTSGDAEATEVHEAAHQWFGDRVVIAHWRDLWLSEGFATYLTTLFYERLDGIDVVRERWADMAAFGPDRQASAHVMVPDGPVDPNAHLTWVPYQKGACLLHLLRLSLGDTAFFDALRETYRRFGGKALDTATFQKILEAQSGADLQGVFDYWAYGNDFPVLSTTWDAGTHTLGWTVSDDAGTLDGVPFELRVRQGNREQYVAAGDGRVVLAGWGEEKPAVQPVGIMMSVQ